MFASLNKQVFSLDALDFFKKFVWLFWLYLAWRFFDFDPTLYAKLNPVMGKAPGLTGVVGLPLPGLPAFRVAQVAGIIACLFAARGNFYKLSSALALISWGLIEFGRNGLGFVNVEIHLFWMACLMSLCPLERKQRQAADHSELASGIFVFLQVILCLAYLQSGFAKLWVSGLEWATSGSTLQIALLRQGLPAGEWLAEHTLLVQALALGSIALETGFVLYPFFARTRAPLLAASIAFHIGTHIFLGISFHHLWILSLGILLFGRALISSSEKGLNYAKN